MPTVFDSTAKAKTNDKQEKKSVNNIPPKNSPAQHTKMGPLTAFAVAPDGVRFETQEEEEEVVLFLRQHLVVLVPPLVLGVILIISPLLIFPFLMRFLELPVAIPPGYMIIGTIFWYLATFGFLLTSFLRWFFNIYIVTDERLVDIDFLYLLYKQFSEARLTKIQDISYKTGGLFAAIFNYGDVLIQTAGELPNFEFEAVPNPEKVVQTISELSEKAKQEDI